MTERHLVLSKVMRSLARWLIALPPSAKVALVATADFLILLAVAAICLRLELHVWAWGRAEYGIHPFLIIGPCVTVPMMMLLGAYRFVVRFIGAEQLLRLIAGVTVGGFTILTIATTLSLNLISIPAAALFVSAGATALVAMRGVAGYLLRPHRTRKSAATQVLIYGAGDAGAQLADALAHSRQYEVVGFIDDNPRLHGRTMRGRRIYARRELPVLRERGAFGKILLAIPSVSRQRQQKILHALEPLAVRVLAMPQLEDLASGRKRVDELRDVRIEDLLGRDPVAPSTELLDLFIRDKTVLVTGAGGSIGSELARLILQRRARKVVLFELSEFALYTVHRQLQEVAGAVELVPVMGNVLDRRYLESVIRQHEVCTIYHAAAYKHVPLVERNPLVAVHNNVIGTLSVTEAAMACGVQNLVLVSTDKAVRPTSVMGASKRVCELIVQALAERNPEARLSIVRFGNVLGSSGSVVPLFREQIRRGGPVTVTHPEVTRYFMTVTEAAQLVVQAGAMGRRGEVFVLDMGQAVRISELAERMIHLSGLRPRRPGDSEGDIEIQYVGLRPGEKLYEELLIGNQPQGTEHPRIFRAQESFHPWSQLRLSLETMDAAIRQANEAVLLQVLRDLVPEFAGQGAATERAAESVSNNVISLSR